MNFLVGMNLSPRWADYLEKSGFAAVHWSDCGLPTASDRELMHWAEQRGHIVLTADLDFPAILAATESRQPSVVVLRGDELTPEALGSALLAAIRQMEPELSAGAILSVDARRARLRILPLQGR
jgi:predicted nuclease of predicted toxin-antitoxin system